MISRFNKIPIHIKSISAFSQHRTTNTNSKLFMEKVRDSEYLKQYQVTKSKQEALKSSISSKAINSLH